MRGEQREQCRTIRQPMQLRHIVERRTGRQMMRLPIVDHLHAVLDRAQ